MKNSNKRIIRDFWSWLLILVMTVTGVFIYPQKSVKAYDLDNNSDFLGIEVIDVDDIWDADDSDSDESDYYETATDSDAELLSESAFLTGASDTYIGTKNFYVYCNKYMIQFLTDNEKAFYDRLDAACHEMLTTTKDAVTKEYTSGGVAKKAYVVADDGIPMGSLNSSRAAEITELFVYNNPQYYFVSYRTLKTTSTMYLVCYDAFADGSQRASITEQMFTKVDGWVTTINAEADDYAKEKKADNIICANTIYLNDTSTPYSEFTSQGWTGFSQTAYSMIMVGKTVCAGYSKTFTMLMNACGILTVGVTSDGHAWNKIRLGGNWYNVDVTWNDGNDGNNINSSRYYLNQTDEEFLNTHNYNVIQESFYDEIAPACIVTFDEDTWSQNYIPVTGISFDAHDDIIIYLFDEDNRSVEVTATVSPADATNKNYNMSIDNDEVAWYILGSVYGANPGKTKLTVRSQDGAYEDTRNIICYDKFGTPSAPDIESITPTTVTVAEPDDSGVFTYEYSKDKTNWQRSNVFSGLSPETSYTFYIRMVGTVYYLTSDASAGTTVKTETKKLTAPSAPTVASKTATSVTLNTISGCEYSKDKVNWQKSPTFTGLKYSTYYTFYARKAASGDYDASDASTGTSVKTDTLTDATVSAEGIFVSSTSPTVVAGCVTKKSQSSADVEYRWLAFNEESPNGWFEVSPWTKNNEWINWKPATYGNYVLVCYARVVGNEEASLIQISTGVETHPYIKGKCQMSYTGKGGGYLIGVESYDNPNQSYSYEMLILDCTLLAQGLPAWTYTTGRCGVSEGNALWTIWQPEYGYYWTLFRVFDKNGTLIDEECYGFQNIY